MPLFPDRRLLDLFRIELPILQAPMAGASTPEMAIAVSEAGGLGALACAMLSVDEARAAITKIRAGTTRSINLNFFCHVSPASDDARMAAWRARLAPYARALGVPHDATVDAPLRKPFDDAYCELVEATRPEVVSFHFGLPPAPLLERVRKTGAAIVSSATTVAEARYLEAHGCDAIIAMGAEAGGHRGSFLTTDMAQQVGTMALVPQVVDAVRVPVIAAGGIGDARGIAAAFVLGASAVQLGTAYLFTPEAKVSPLHREALASASDDDTAITNVFTGRPARGVVNRLVREVGPLSGDVPPFPLAASALLPLRAKAEAAGSADFTSMWSGQAARLGRAMPAGELTRTLMEEAIAKLGQPS